MFLIALLQLALAQSAVVLNSQQSLYLGEAKTLSLDLPSQVNSTLAWTVNKDDLEQLDGGDLVVIQPKISGKKLQVQLVVPYIAPSFENLHITLTGKDSTTQATQLELNLQLSVRAELVIRFRPRSENFLLNSVISEQSNSDFEWDLPRDPKTGKYIDLNVNNHVRGLWVRFRYEGTPNDLLRSGGYVIHIYRGEGQYIVHQPFDSTTHLMKSECPLEPLSEEELKNPELGLDAKGKPWANCEFRGFVPAQAAYGFGFREHYIESEEHQKFVTIKNDGELNKDLVEYYTFLEENGMGLSALCQAW